MGDMSGLTSEVLREGGRTGGRATAWNRQAATIQEKMQLGCEDDINMDIRASWDFTMKRWFGK